MGISVGSTHLARDRNTMWGAISRRAGAQPRAAFGRALARVSQPTFVGRTSVRLDIVRLCSNDSGDRPPAPVVIDQKADDSDVSLAVDDAPLKFPDLMALGIGRRPLMPGIIHPFKVTGRLQTTGRMGEVMKESSSISHTYAQHFLRNVDSNNKFLDSATLHMHIPEGAVPKDGPSAGVTMTTSLLSLALKQPVRKDLAMTGELTLTGKVLPVGGIKEKTIAAKRSGVTKIMLPEANQRDFDELPDYVKEGMEVHYASNYQVSLAAFSSAVLTATRTARSSSFCGT